ncbi:hypothetical protein [Cryobacterium sp. Hb1]|uniref:hypothetical protein n=1 Tax=Cryobacterium sp. Hb1 TaxID=1259147 RepID=UPI001068F3A2|nr:hypothetical protein [Cryobacterium sp. Hb1]TFD72130.1 hypothetical protein E3T38_01140 [Cryobacterium sp. Hb1]
MIAAVVIIATVTGLTACDTADEPAGRQPTGGATNTPDEPAARHSITATVQGATAEVTAGNLDSVALPGLRDVALIGAVVGVPVRIELDAEIPEHGVKLQRTYLTPVPDDAAATFIFFNEEFGAWEAVASELSPDRRTLTATVHHLSLWDDIVAGGQQSLQIFTAAAAAAGHKVSDASTIFGKALKVVNANIKTAFTNGSEALYYGIGKVFDTRVDDPVCDDATPSWVTSTEMIGYNANNPILFCVGRDRKNPDLLVVKARVNRGFGYTVSTATEPSWMYNSTGNQGAWDATLDLVGDTDQVIREGVEKLYSSGDLVGAGQEVSYGFAQGPTSEVPAGTPLVTLSPPNIPVFVRSSIEQALVSWGTEKAKGGLAATIVVAACFDEINAAEDGYGGVKVALTCLSKADTPIAKQLALSMLKLGGEPKAAGLAAGQLIARASLGLAVIAPATNVLNYVAELGVPASARTVTVFTRTSQTEDISSWVIGYGTLGPLSGGMTMAEMAVVMDVPMNGNQWGLGMDDFSGYCALGSLAATGPAAHIGFLAESGGSYGPVDRFFISGSDDNLTALPRTLGGTGVGSTETDVRNEFGSVVKEDQNIYVEGGKILSVLDDNAGIVFVTDETGSVTAVITGNTPQIFYPEGCA